MMKIVLTSIFLCASIGLYSQKSTWERNDWIYWQSDKPLTFENFKGNVGDCGSDILEDTIKIEVSACIGIWSILDIPKSRKKGGGYERFYFAPVFNQQKSWAKSDDSIAILKQQVFFDLSELVTRLARKDLYQLREKLDNATGTTAIYYSTIKKQMLERQDGVFASYFNAVFRTNSIDSLNHWVDFTAEMLEETKEFKTSEIEFERLLTGQPEKGFKQAESIIGPM